MVRNSVKRVTVIIIAVALLGAPGAVAAQSARSRLAAQCVDDGATRARPAYRTTRSVSQRAIAYEEREPERTKTKTALMIAGSAAAGAGVGGALSGKKGALIGAAVGGGAASIYEAAKRR
jgi:hypothetical protein